MKKYLTLAMVLTLVLAFWSAPAVQAQDTADDGTPAFVDENGDGIDDNIASRHRFGRHHRHLLKSAIRSQLTEEQQAALKEKIQTLISAGATKTEIHDAVTAELEALGVDITAAQLERYSSVLSAEQLATLKEKLDVLKADGATDEEIHAAIHTELEALGITRPSKGHGRLSSVLTEEQLTALQEKINALEADGATRQEVHDAINAELEALGIDPPAKGPKKGRHGRRGGHRGRH